MKPVFTPIEPGTWPSAQAFYYYTQMAPTTYTVNVSVDVTTARKTHTSYPAFPGSPSTAFSCIIMASRTVLCRVWKRADSLKAAGQF